MSAVTKCLAAFAFLAAFCGLFPFPAGAAEEREEIRRMYDALTPAVVAASLIVYGEYGDKIPDDFTAARLMELVKGEMPKEYLDELKKYRIDVKPKGSYYLLLVFDPITGALVLFDYSCTLRPDGLVLLEPERYDTGNLDRYDSCKPAPGNAGTVEP